MKQANNGAASKLGPVVLCGVLSVLIDFILIPQLLSRLPRFLRSLLLPDPIWISLMFLIPVLVAIYLLEQKAHIPARYVWVGLPVQYLILIIFAAPIYKITPLASDEWTYIGAVMIWPLGVTAAQFASLAALRFRNTKRSKRQPQTRNESS